MKWFQNKFKVDGRLNSVYVDVIVELKQNDEVSTLFVKYSGDDTIATGAKFKQKFTSFRFVTTRIAT